MPTGETEDDNRKFHNPAAPVNPPLEKTHQIDNDNASYYVAAWFRSISPTSGSANQP